MEGVLEDVMKKVKEAEVESLARQDHIRRLGIFINQSLLKTEHREEVG